MKNHINASLEESRQALNSLISSDEKISAIEAAAKVLIKALENGNAIYSCGNGGSMSDAMHFAEELTGRNYISWSSVSTFQACPLKWYFRYALGLSEKTVSSSLVFGGAIHQSIEVHYRELMMGKSCPGPRHAARRASAVGLTGDRRHPEPHRRSVRQYRRGLRHARRRSAPPAFLDR